MLNEILSKKRHIRGLYNYLKASLCRQTWLSYLKELNKNRSACINQKQVYLVWTNKIPFNRENHNYLNIFFKTGKRKWWRYKKQSYILQVMHDLYEHHYTILIVKILHILVSRKVIILILFIKKKQIQLMEN
jgi:hypothetical protein